MFLAVGEAVSTKDVFLERGAGRCEGTQLLQQTLGANGSHPTPAHGGHRSPGANLQVQPPRKAPTQYKYCFLPATNPARAGERLPGGLSNSEPFAALTPLLFGGKTINKRTQNKSWSFTHLQNKFALRFKKDHNLQESEEDFLAWKQRRKKWNEVFRGNRRPSFGRVGRGGISGSAALSTATAAVWMNANLTPWSASWPPCWWGKHKVTIIQGSFTL